MTPLLLLATLAGAPPDLPGAHEVVRESDSQPTLLMAWRDTPRATLYVQFRVGGYDDGPQPGLTRLTQYALLGANRRTKGPALLDRLYAAGAELEVETGQQTAAFVLEAPARDFDDLAETLLTQLLAPRFDAKAYPQARSRMLQDSPRFGTAELASMFSQATMPERGFSRDPLGDRTIVRELTAQVVQAHAKVYFLPSNATVVLAGRFDAERLRTKTMAFRGGKRREPAQIERELAGLHTLRAPFDLHMLGLPAPIGTTQQAAVMRLAASILHHRVMRRFRALGIAYSTHAVAMRRPWLNFVLVTLPIHGSAHVSVEGELKRIVEGLGGARGLTEADFAKHRRILLSELRHLDRQPSALARELALGGGDVPWLSTEVAAAIEALDRDTFQRQVEPWARAGRGAHVLLSPNPAAVMNR